MAQVGKNRSKMDRQKNLLTNVNCKYCQFFFNWLILVKMNENEFKGGRNLREKKTLARQGQEEKNINISYYFYFFLGSTSLVTK